MVVRKSKRIVTAIVLGMLLGLALTACGSDQDSGPPPIEDLEAAGVEGQEDTPAEAPPAAPYLPPVGQYQLFPVEVEASCTGDSQLDAGLEAQTVTLQLLDQGQTLTLDLSALEEPLPLSRVLQTDQSSEFEGQRETAGGLLLILSVFYSSADAEEILQGTFVVEDPAANCSVLTDFSLTQIGS